MLGLGLSEGPDPPENPTDPTRTERFWAGLKIFGSGFGSASGLLYMQILNLIFFFKKKNPTLRWFLSASASLSYSPSSIEF